MTWDFTNIEDNIFVYLASPYSDPSRAIKDQRFLDVTRMSGLLTQAGIANISPITMTHEQCSMIDLPTNWEFWAKVDENMIKRCDEVWVHRGDGWIDSVGVQAEIQIAHNNNMTVRLVGECEGKFFEEEMCKGYEEFWNSSGEYFDHMDSEMEGKIRGYMLDALEAIEEEEPEEDISVNPDTITVKFDDDSEMCNVYFAREASDAEAVKYDAYKPALSRIPIEARIGAAKVMAHGAEKYGWDNWKKGMEWHRVLSAAERHLAAFTDDIDEDPDSGLPHIDHALCCIMFLSEYYHKGIGTDDR